MTVTTTTNRDQAAGNGSNVDFTYTFKIVDETHLEVYITDANDVETLQTLTTHYTVSGVGDAGGGTVTFVTAPASTETVTIRRVVPNTQTTDYINNDALDADSVLETDFDLAAMRDQQYDEVLDRTLRLPITTQVADPEATGTLPEVSSAEANKAITVNSAGDGFTFTALTSLTQQSVTFVSGDAKKPIGVDDAGAALEARTDLTLTTLNGTGGAAVDMPDGIKADTVAESTAGAGVTLDSVLLKDGYAPFMPRHIQGIVPSNDDAADGDDINFTAGSASTYSSGGTRYNTVASAEMTKLADATWAAGDDAGGMTSGVSWSATTTYHLFLLGKQNDQSAYDYGFDTSLTAANLLADAAVVAAGFNTYRRVASFKSTSTPGWRGFTAWEDAGGALRIEYSTAVTDVSNYSAATTRQTQVLTVPLGLSVGAILYVDMRYSSALSRAWVRSTSYTDATPGLPDQDIFVDADGHQAFVNKVVPTNTSGQIAHRQSDTGSVLDVATLGYVDWRR